MAQHKMLYPAYLLVGKQEELEKQVYDFLQQAFCVNNACKQCVSCKQITGRQHYLVRWIVPENSYTIATLEPIFATAAYALDSHEHFFFVLDRIETLNTASANSLLKILEEPPTGYHFILLSPWLEGILPTIISRCIVQSFVSTAAQQEHALLPFFTQLKMPDFMSFAKELDRLKVTEHDVTTILDQLRRYWLSQLKKALFKEDQELVLRVSKITELLAASREYMPMPGSSKYFLKNLFLQIHNL